MVILILILLWLFICLWQCIIYHFNYWQRRGIPHVKTNIFIGNISELLLSKYVARIFYKIYENFKGVSPYVGFYFNMQKALIVLDIELARKVLIKDFVYFENRGFSFHNEKSDPLMDNLLLIDGLKWRWLRAKLTPCFTAKKMKYLFATVLKVGEELPKTFNVKLCENSEKLIEITDLLKRFTADVIASSVFGLDCHSLNDPGAEFWVKGRKLFTRHRRLALVDGLISCFPKLAQFLHIKMISQEINHFYMSIFKNKIRCRLQQKIKKFDFMDLLIELKNQPVEGAKERLTEEVLAAQAFAFFMAGFHTSAMTMCYALYELAQNQDIQHKLRQEIKEVLQLYEQKFSYECMKEMKYLDQVLAETLRKYPVAPALYRKCTKRYETSDPHFYIEKDCMIIIPTLSYHHDPEYFPEPKKFDPERFSPVNGKNIKSCSYLPFGGGTRHCIGRRFGLMQTSIGLVQLIRSFKFEIYDQSKKPIDLDGSSFNLSPKEGITLKVMKI